MSKTNRSVAITPSSFSKSSNDPLRLANKISSSIKINKLGRRLNEKETIKILNGCEAVIAGLENYNEKVFSNCPDLKAISRVGIGLDNIDLKAAAKYNVNVFNTPDEPAFAVAEMTIAILLHFMKNIEEFNRNTHKKIWRKKINQSLYNSNFLIIGYGRIGKKLSNLLEPFGCNIFINDPEYKNHKNYIDLSSGIKKADIISLHANTDNEILKAGEFKKMKKGVVIVNPSRDILVNVDSLIKFVDNKTVRFAWFDAFKNEPYKGKMIGKDKILLTPHISTYTDKCRKSMELKSVENLINFFNEK